MKNIKIKSNNIKTLNAINWLGNRMKSINCKQNRLYNLLTLILMMFSSSLLAQLNLESVNYKNSIDGTVEISFKFDGKITSPDVFQTTRPARIAIDLPGVYNNSGKNMLSIAKGNTKSMRIVSSNEKTRAVIDLLKAAEHDVKTNGNEIIVTISGNKLVSNQHQSERKYSIENIDFRRGKNGQGSLVISFDKPGAVVNLRETADKVKLEISSTILPAAYDNKLDVIDFATPVSYVDVRSRGGNVIVEVMANGAYEHMAYQTGGKYVLEISEKVEDIQTAAERLNKEIIYEGNKVSFNFSDIEVRSVLQLIADASQLNIIAANSVQGSVTLRLSNVPWDQALDTVLNSMQLDKRQTGNVIWVAPAQEIADREQQKLLALKEKEEFEPLKTIYVTINYAKAEELASLLQGDDGGTADSETGGGQGLLSSRGSVTYDERTNTLLISDVPDNLVIIEELIKKLDVAVKQVQIESRIVVASDKFGEELGVRFGLNGSKQDSHGNILSTGGSLSALDDLNNSALNNMYNSPSGSPFPNFTPGPNGSRIIGPSLGERLNVNLPSAASNAAHWAFSILAADYLLDLELSALETEGRGEVISTPRVVTTNQHKAVIKQGIEIPFQTISGVGGSSTITTTFKEAVLLLEVTPLITPDDRVDLTLLIKKDSIGEFVPTGFGGSVPSIDKREIDTRVLVGNGQTIVLGGIYEQIKRTEKSKVPILGDLPGLGMLFRSKTKQNDKAELLIFVTPTIIKESL